jgi:hypothetical protein
MPNRRLADAGITCCVEKINAWNSRIFIGLQTFLDLDGLKPVVDSYSHSSSGMMISGTMVDASPGTGTDLKPLPFFVIGHVAKTKCGHPDRNTKR